MNRKSIIAMKQLRPISYTNDILAEVYLFTIFDVLSTFNFQFY